MVLPPSIRLVVPALLAAAATVACIDDETARGIAETIQFGANRPDEMPVMLNTELPFRYPQALYAEKVQGNVELRLFVDSTGVVRPESTMVETSSGLPALDSAAVQGSRELRFVPAKKDGAPVAVAVVFPVYFRHPEAAPLPGDTILEQGRGRGEEGRVGVGRP